MSKTSDIRFDFNLGFGAFVMIVHDFYLQIPFGSIADCVYHNEPFPLKTPICDFSFEPVPEYDIPVLLNGFGKERYVNFLSTVFSDWFEAFYVRQYAFDTIDVCGNFNKDNYSQALQDLQFAYIFIQKYSSLSVEIFNDICDWEYEQ